MSIFSTYILGVVITGSLFFALLYIKSFEIYMFNDIDKAKNEYKNSDKCGDAERILIDALDNNSIINFLVIAYSILSWIGFFLLLLNIITWLFTKN